MSDSGDVPRERGPQGRVGPSNWKAYIAMGVAVVITLFVFQTIFQHRLAEGLRDAADSRIDLVEDAAYEDCVEGQQILRLFNQRFGAPFRKFATDAADNRAKLATDMSQARSVRRQNARAARDYYAVARQVKPFAIPRCTR